MLRNGKLQSLHRRCQRLSYRLTHHKMDVFRHNNIAKHIEPITGTCGFESLDEKIAGCRSIQVRLAIVATERDEVVVARSVVPLQVERHGWIVDPRVGLCPMPTLGTMKLCRRWGTAVVLSSDFERSHQLV